MIKTMMTIVAKAMVVIMMMKTGSAGGDSRVKVTMIMTILTITESKNLSALKSSVQVKYKLKMSK